MGSVRGYVYSLVAVMAVMLCALFVLMYWQGNHLKEIQAKSSAYHLPSIILLAEIQDELTVIERELAGNVSITDRADASLFLVQEKVEQLQGLQIGESRDLGIDRIFGFFIGGYSDFSYSIADYRAHAEQAKSIMYQQLRVFLDRLEQLRILHYQENRKLVQHLQTHERRLSQRFALFLAVLLLVGGYVVSRILRAISVTMREKAAMRDELHKSVQLLERSNQELEEFNYVASHDLQEPVRTLVSYCTFLQKDVPEEHLNDRAKQDLAFITDAAKRMQQLIRDLLQLSRAGRSEFRLESVDLNHCMETVSKDLQVAIHECGARIDADPLPVVLGDETHLTRVLQNLVSNALKFRNGDQVKIHVYAQQAGPGWRIFVEDNGIGIESQYLEMIFAPFKRLHGMSEYQGSGIGLAVCRKIIQRHHGEMHVESQPGAGSSFSFTLPSAA